MPSLQTSLWISWFIRSALQVRKQYFLISFCANYEPCFLLFAGNPTMRPRFTPVTFAKSKWRTSDHINGITIAIRARRNFRAQFAQRNSPRRNCWKNMKRYITSQHQNPAASAKRTFSIYSNLRHIVVHTMHQRKSNNCTNAPIVAKCKSSARAGAFFSISMIVDQI